MEKLPRMAIVWNKLPKENDTLEHNKWLYAWEVMMEIHTYNNKLQ